MPLDISPAAQFIGGVILFIILGLSGNKLNNVRKKIQSKSRSTDDTIANLNEGIRVLKSEIASLKKERDETNERHGVLQAKFEDQQKEIESLKANIKSVESKAAAIATERDNEIRTNAKTANELADERKLTSQQERRIVELEREVAQLKLDIQVKATVESMYTGMVDRLSVTGYRLVKDTQKLPPIESPA